jgi:sulfoxide reductase heme-binding subunit YedZ
VVLRDWLRRNWHQALTHIAGLLPLARLLWTYWRGAFLVDPVREITTRTGRTALLMLLLSLACTPIHILLGLKWVLRVRRALGLYAFLYAALHFLSFAGLDYGLQWGLLWPAIFAQRFILPGFAAGVILLMLAITSTGGWQARLGRNWKRLHRLVYLAGILAIVHVLWMVKDIGEPLRYAAILALLLVLRLPHVRTAVSHARRTRLPSGPES